MFIIVKHAKCWHEYFEQDPALGCHPSYSAHTTYSGKELGVKSSYDNEEEAKVDCEKLNQSNPSGCYGVCPVQARC